MPKIIKPANGSFTTADITVDSSGRIIAASTGSAGGSFISATGGDVVTEEGNYKVHRFNSDGNFVVSSVGSGDPESAAVDYVVVAGGGGGGAGGSGRGGGGGGGAGGGSCSCFAMRSSRFAAVFAFFMAAALLGFVLRASTASPTAS